MGNAAEFFDDAKNTLKKAREHAWFQHHDADGWITVAKKQKDGEFIQYHYKPEELAEILTEWLGEDVYFSQNTFYKPQRRIENIRQLRSLYVDVDFYLLNYDPDWILGKLEMEFFGNELPAPNITIFSGRGIVLVWLIDPVPYNGLPLWQAIQNNFLEKLQEIGGDSKSSDAARVFRLAGTTNSNNGIEVRAEYRHDYRYDLRTLQYDYLPDLEINPNKQRKKKGRKNKVQHLFNIYRLYHARLLDLTKLIEIRNYDVKGYRETMCFLYRYWSCCFLNDPVQALDATLTLNSQFNEPLSLVEVKRATRSAEKAYEARNNEKANQIAISKGYPGAGYNLKNSTIIEWLDITREEQIHLSTIIDGVEKRRRKRERDKEYQEQKRRERGDMTRSEYVADQRERKEEKKFLLQKAMEKHPEYSNYKLAQHLGISEPYVRSLKKELA